MFRLTKDGFLRLFIMSGRSFGLESVSLREAGRVILLRMTKRMDNVQKRWWDFQSGENLTASILRNFERGPRTSLAQKTSDQEKHESNLDLGSRNRAKARCMGYPVIESSPSVHYFRMISLTRNDHHQLKDGSSQTVSTEKHIGFESRITAMTCSSSVSSVTVFFIKFD